MLWFDVESKYEATRTSVHERLTKLWFDVESKYEATHDSGTISTFSLWFDVESKYEATLSRKYTLSLCVVV